MNVAIPTIQSIALCAGYGGLDIGLSAACALFGVRSRTVAYLEREAYAAALLAARMEQACLDPAPIWSDLCTFDAARWRGKVDCISAGFPCQPHSFAGKRAGTGDERWIWNHITRIIRDSGARLVVLENVPGLLNSGGFDPVISDLAEMGFDAQWGCVSAASVGASHERERVFILADHSGFVRQLFDGSGNCESGESMESIEQMADTNGCRCRRCASGHEIHVSKNAGNVQSDSVAPFCSALFAPGPVSSEWGNIDPHLAPEVEPGFRVLVNGVAKQVDRYRKQQLRCAGNGVVPLQAGFAIAQLMQRLR